MKYYSQRDNRWKNHKLGYCKDSIYKSGCKLCSLASFTDKTPPEVNELLKRKGGYTDGCLINDQVAANILGIRFKGRIYSNPTFPCIMETNHFKNVGVKQHFVVMIDDKHIADPLDNPVKIKKNKFNIISYRLFVKSTMKTYYVKSNLRNVLKELDKRFEHTKEKDHKKMAGTLKEYMDDHEKLEDNYNKSLGLINKLRTELKEKDYMIALKNDKLGEQTKANIILAEQVEELEKELGSELLYKINLGKLLIIIRRKK